jgi:hypothetical protein
MGLVSPWKPTTDPYELKHLGKLAEELSEAGAAVARCIIQGINEDHPVTGKPNIEWLEDELADVIANINLVTEFFILNKNRMNARVEQKMGDLSRWHKM